MLRKQSERALQATNSELKDADNAKDHFLADISHKLRAPLNVITGFTGACSNW